MDKTINLWGLVKKKLDVTMQVETLGETPSHKGAPPTRNTINSCPPPPGCPGGMLRICRELLRVCRDLL